VLGKKRLDEVKGIGVLYWYSGFWYLRRFVLVLGLVFEAVVLLWHWYGVGLVWYGGFAPCR
jgi:hypothetical protein